jgi:hypothetical protein
VVPKKVQKVHKQAPETLHKQKWWLRYTSHRIKHNSLSNAEMPFWTMLHKQIFCTQKQYIDAKHRIYLAGRRPSKMLLVLKESSNRMCNFAIFRWKERHSHFLLQKDLQIASDMYVSQSTWCIVKIQIIFLLVQTPRWKLISLAKICCHLAPRKIQSPGSKDDQGFNQQGTASAKAPMVW